MTYPAFIKDRFLNKEVHIVASGPSLIGFDYSYFNDKIVVAVNHTYKLVKNHDYVVFNDQNFLKESPGVLEDANNVICPRTVGATGTHSEKVISINLVKQFEKDPEKSFVYSSKSSGVSALTTVIHGGAEKIYLWGFDCCFFNKGMVLETAQRNKVTTKTMVDLITSDRVNYGHSTTGIFKHTQDDIKQEHVFTKTIELFEVFEKLYPGKVVNISQFSGIPYFRRGFV